MLDPQWRTAAEAFGIQASQYWYWLFVWPEGAEVVAAGSWTVFLPPGLPPVWDARGFDNFDAARVDYYDWRASHCLKSKPSKTFIPGAIGDLEQDD